MVHTSASCPKNVIPLVLRKRADRQAEVCKDKRDGKINQLNNAHHLSLTHSKASGCHTSAGSVFRKLGCRLVIMHLFANQNSSIIDLQTYCVCDLHSLLLSTAFQCRDVTLAPQVLAACNSRAIAFQADCVVKSCCHLGVLDIAIQWRDVALAIVIVSTCDGRAIALQADCVVAPCCHLDVLDIAIQFRDVAPAI